MRGKLAFRLLVLFRHTRYEAREILRLDPDNHFEAGKWYESQMDEQWAQSLFLPLRTALSPKVNDTSAAAHCRKIQSKGALCFISQSQTTVYNLEVTREYKI